MVKHKDLRKEFPSVIDRAYGEYKKHPYVESIMSSEIVTTTTQVTMKEVARLMGERHIGSLIVNHKP